MKMMPNDYKMQVHAVQNCWGEVSKTRI